MKGKGREEKEDNVSPTGLPQLFFSIDQPSSKPKSLALIKITLYGPYILESVVHDGFAFIKKGGFPYVKYGNNWHLKG